MCSVSLKDQGVDSGVSVKEDQGVDSGVSLKEDQGVDSGVSLKEDQGVVWCFSERRSGG